MTDPALIGPPDRDAPVVDVSHLEDAMAVLRSPSFSPIRPESGHGAQYVAALTGNALSDLASGEHLERRRLLTQLFRGPLLGAREHELLLPSLEVGIRRVLARREGQARMSFDLLAFCRGVFTVLMTDLVGLVGLEDDKSRLEFDADFVLVERGARAKFADNPSGLVGDALAAQDRIMNRHFAPAWEAEMTGLAPQPISVNLISTMARHRDHYERWDPELVVREATLFMVASIGSTANAVCHAVYDIEDWRSAHGPQLPLDPLFLDAAFRESVRLHQTNVLLRTAVDRVTLPSGVVIPEGHVVSVNREAINHRIEEETPRPEEETARPEGRFDPFREGHGELSDYGLAFGHGPHVCIGRRMILGDSEPPSKNRPIGVALLTLQHIYREGLTLDPARPPVLYDDMSRETWREFPVLIGA